MGVILAGGQSRRMGHQNKAHMLLDGIPLIDHVIARLAPQLGQLAINCATEPEPGFANPYPILLDTIPGRPGPLAGVLAGLDWAAQSGSDHLVTAPVDTPFLPLDLVETLMASSAGFAIARTKDGWQPTIGLWPVSAREDLRQAIGSGARKVIDWALGLGAVAVDFDDASAFLNINAPQDLERAQAQLGTRA